MIVLLLCVSISFADEWAYSVSLNGTGAYLNCSSSACATRLNIVSDQTIEGWIRLENLSSSHDFAGIISRPGSYALTLRVSGTTYPYGYLQLDYNYGGSARQLQTTAPLGRDTWYHVAAVFKNTSSTSMNAKIFINGLELASQNLSGSSGFLDNANGKFYLGKVNYNSGVSFPGQIEEVRVSNTSRYTTHFSKPVAPFASDANTLFLLHFDEGIGISAFAGALPASLQGAEWEVSNASSSILQDCDQVGGSTIVIGPDSSSFLSHYTRYKLLSGQTLMLCDGIYDGSIYFYGRRFVDVDTGIGTKATIKAKNDGMAILDGKLSRQVNRERKSGMIQLVSSSGVDIEGIHVRDCFNPQAAQCSMIELIYNTSYVNLTRISALRNRAQGVPEGDIATIYGSELPDFVTVYPAHHILMEDCAIYGFGRIGMFVSWSTHNITLRRLFTLIDGANMSNTWCTNVELYGGADNLLENVIAFTNTTDPLPCHNGTQHYQYPGFMIPGSRQRVLGSISKEQKGNSFYTTGCNYCTFQDIVSINSTHSGNTQIGFYANRGRFDSSLIGNVLKGYTYIGGQSNGWGFYLSSDTEAGDSFSVNRSYFLQDGGYSFYKGDTAGGSLLHSSNRFSLDANAYMNTAAGANEERQAASYDPAKYGYGAYLMSSKTNLSGLSGDGLDIGANILFRYEDGVLTEEPLWPWPMEDRILNETGRSVTWYSNGGLWKTLDGVYSEDSPPTLSGIEILPAVPSTLSDLVCDVVVLDDTEQDIDVEYFWYNGSSIIMSGNVTVTNGSSETVSTVPSATTSVGDTWNCTARAYDGSSYSDYCSAQVTVINIPPETGDLIIEPSSPSIMDTLVCNATLNDSEETILAAEYWWLNGTTVKYHGIKTGIANSTSTVISTLGHLNLSYGDTWNCTVRALDSYNHSANRSASISIAANQPPQMTQPSIFPASPTTSSDLSCNATPSDIENSTLLVEWWWYDGTDPIFHGNVTAGNGTPVELSLGSANLTMNDTWNCSFRSYDGYDMSSIISSSTTILNEPISILSSAPNGTLTSGTSYVEINITTDRDATCRLSNESVPYLLMVPFDTTGTSYHMFNATGLADNESYTYFIRCADNRGNIDTEDHEINFSVSAMCVESWSCSAWSACASSVKTRTCNDLNSCGTTTSMPPLSDGCTSGSSGGGGGRGGSIVQRITKNISIEPIREDISDVWTSYSYDEVFSIDICCNLTGQPKVTVLEDLPDGIQGLDDATYLMIESNASAFRLDLASNMDGTLWHYSAGSWEQIDAGVVELERLGLFALRSEVENIPEPTRDEPPEEKEIDVEQPGGISHIPLAVTMVPMLALSAIAIYLLSRDPSRSILSDAIRRARSSGHTDEQIQKALIKKGWNPKIVGNALKKTKRSSPSPSHR